MTRPSVLVLACGALARELEAAFKVNRVDNVKVEYLSAALHNRPERICEMLRTRLASVRRSFDRVFLGYADCGTGGRLDAVLQRWNVRRLPGAHCYEFFATSEIFHALAEAEPGTFYLTDFLVRHFDRLVIEDLKLNTHPELRETLFAHYTRVVYLSQTQESELLESAQRAADQLALPLEVVVTGMGDLQTAMAAEIPRWQENPGGNHATH